MAAAAGKGRARPGSFTRRTIYGAIVRQEGIGGVWSCNHDHDSAVQARMCAAEEIERRKQSGKEWDE